MTYKGFRISKKLEIFDLNDQKISEPLTDIEDAKEYVDRYLEATHRGKIISSPETEKGEKEL